MSNPYAAAPELLAFAIEYLWAEHGEIAPNDSASCLSSNQLRDAARAAIAKSLASDVDDVARERDL